TGGLQRGAEGELAATDFDKAGLFSLGVQLTQHGGIKRAGRGASLAALPVALGRHGRNQLRTAQSLATLTQHLGRSVESTELVRWRSRLRGFIHSRRRRLLSR